MPERYIHPPGFQIDTNRINARQMLPNMNQLEKWAEEGVISLDISQTAMQEVSSGKDLQRNQKTGGMIYSITHASRPNERRDMALIAGILFPCQQLKTNAKKDVEIVFNAKKYGYILVTNDGGSKKQPGGILGNRVELKKQLGVDILTDEEAVKLVRQKIASRDILARRVSEQTGQKLPDWVGKD